MLNTYKLHHNNGSVYRELYPCSIDFSSCVLGIHVPENFLKSIAPWRILSSLEINKNKSPHMC